jgi:hypothetical protein
MKTNLSLFRFNGELGSIPWRLFGSGFRRLLRKRFKLILFGTRLTLALRTGSTLSFRMRLSAPFSPWFIGTRRPLPPLTEPTFIRQTTILFLRAELFHPLLLFGSQNERLVVRFLLTRGTAPSALSVTLRLAALLRRPAFLFPAARSPLFLRGLPALLVLERGRWFLLFRSFLLFRFVLLAEHGSNLLD